MNTEKREKAAEIYKLSQNLTTTLQILVSDVKYAEAQLAKDKKSEQFWRRMIVRAVCALGEATLNALKGMMPKTADFFDFSLTADDMEFLTELRKSPDAQMRPFFFPIQKNFKETIGLFAKIHGIQSEIKYSQGYEDFCGTFKLRNKLMHPRKHFDVAINDNDYKSSIRGWNWFNFTLIAVLRECGKKLPLPVKTGSV